MESRKEGGARLTALGPQHQGSTDTVTAVQHAAKQDRTRRAEGKQPSRPLPHVEGIFRAPGAAARHVKTAPAIARHGHCP
eukprot:11439628-Alexandrium_andersonii.AAC.1